MELSDIFANNSVTTNTQKPENKTTSNEFATILESSNQFTVASKNIQSPIEQTISKNDFSSNDKFINEDKKDNVKYKTSSNDDKTDKNQNIEENDKPSDKVEVKDKERTENKDNSKTTASEKETQETVSNDNEISENDNNEVKTSESKEASENKSTFENNNKSDDIEQNIEEIINLIANNPELAQILQITPNMSADEMVSAIEAALPKIQTTIENLPTNAENTELKEALTLLKDNLGQVKTQLETVKNIPTQEAEEIISQAEELFKNIDTLKKSKNSNTNALKDDQANELAKFVKEGEKLEIKVENNNSKPVEAKITNNKVVEVEATDKNETIAENITENNKTVSKPTQTANNNVTANQASNNNQDTQASTQNNAQVNIAAAQVTTEATTNNTTTNNNISSPTLTEIGVGNSNNTAKTTLTAKAEARVEQNISSKEVVEQVKVNITKNAVKGVDRINIELKPKELGSVEVKLEVGKDGKLKAEIIAEKSETLAILQKDSNSLEKALNDAGFDTKDSQLTFTSKEEQNQQNRNQEQKEIMSKILANGNKEEITNLNDLNNLDNYSTTNPNGGLNIRV